MQHLLQTLRFQPHETIASLGVGGGFWEVGFGAMVPGLTVYLVETSAELLNEAEVAAAVDFWGKQTGKPVESRFVPVLGTDTSTSLPEGIFDKILLLNSFHEFTQPEAMLAECRRALKPDGLLFVEERLARFPGEIHEGCGRRLFSESELIALFFENGFAFQCASSRDGSDFWKVLTFAPPPVGRPGALGLRQPPDGNELMAVTEFPKTASVPASLPST